MRGERLHACAFHPPLFHPIPLHSDTIHSPASQLSLPISRPKAQKKTQLHPPPASSFSLSVVVVVIPGSWGRSRRAKAHARA